MRINGMKVTHAHTTGSFPDLGIEPCCIGSAVYGPGRCTCWEEIYDLEQEEPKGGCSEVRSEMCHDCAFRPGSPERTGQEGYAHNEPEDMEELFDPGRTFVCHQGMRSVVAYKHPESDELAPNNPGVAYRPPRVGKTEFKADGTPADICAGWAARKALRERLNGNAVNPVDPA